MLLRLDAPGQLEAVLTPETVGTYGLNGLGADPVGNLYAADTGRNRILVLSPNGQLLREVGHGGVDLGGLTQPWMVAFASDGSFFVADWENSRIEAWNTRFEATDVWSTGFHPAGVAAGHGGPAFVPDTRPLRIEVDSTPGALLGGNGVPGSPRAAVTPQPACSRQSLQL